MVGLADLEGHVAHEFLVHHAVDRDADAVAAVGHGHRHLVVIAQDQGHFQQQMRADRRDHDAGHAGRDDRAAAGESIARTPRRRGHDEAVAGILLDEVAVDAQVDADELAHIAVADDDVVEGIGQGLDQAVFIAQFRMEHHPFFQEIAAGQDVFHALFQGLGLDFVEEAQGTQVDAADRDIGFSELLGHLEDRPVAAEDHGHVDGAVNGHARPQVFSADALIRRLAALTDVGWQVIFNAMFFTNLDHLLDNGSTFTFDEVRENTDTHGDHLHFMGFTDDIIDDSVGDIVMARVIFTAVQEIFNIAVSPFDGRKSQAQRRQAAVGDAVRDVADDVAVDLDVADDAAFADVFPARFELRLDERDHRAACLEQRFDGRHDLEQGNEGDVNGDEIDGLADICNGDVADIGPFHVDDAVISPQFPGQLAIADVDGKDLGRAALEGAVREAACRGANIHHGLTRQVDGKRFHGLFQFQAAPADIGNGIALNGNIYVDGQLRARLIDALVVDEDQAGHDGRLGLFPAFRQAAADEKHV